MKTLNTFSMKQAQTIGENCVGCNKCMKNCPMLSQHCTTPKSLFNEISDSGVVNREFVFSCSGCDYCNHVCPKQLDIKAFCFEVKKSCIAEDQGINKKGELTVVNFHKASIHPIFTYLDKAIKKGDVDTVFMPGCSLSSAHPKLIKKIIDKMNLVEPIGLFVDCCGNPIYSIGDQVRFEENLNRLNRLFKDKGIKKMVTACANCHKMFDGHYDVAVEDLWRYMDRHSEVFIASNAEKSKEITYILHDPCPFRKKSETHEAVRSLAKKMKIDIHEFDDNKSLGPCCGAGGMMELIKPDQAIKNQQQRAQAAGDHRIVSYCQSCVDGFTKVGNPGIHLLEIVFDQVNEKRQQPTTLSRWYNRFVVGNILK